MLFRSCAWEWEALFPDAQETRDWIYGIDPESMNTLKELQANSCSAYTLQSLGKAVMRINLKNYRMKQSTEWHYVVDQLKKIVDESGLTQEEIAVQCGMQQQTISRILLKKFVPKLSSIVQICEALNCKLIANKNNEVL